MVWRGHLGWRCGVAGRELARRRDRRGQLGHSVARQRCPVRVAENGNMITHSVIPTFNGSTVSLGATWSRKPGRPISVSFARELGAGGEAAVKRWSHSLRYIDEIRPPVGRSANGMDRLLPPPAE